ncbi:MAG: 3-deoxy-D-manno-octulosonic acid transferase [Bacteroidales bacterium]
MITLYKFGIYIFILLLRAAAFFNGKARASIKGRTLIWNDLSGIDAERNLIWIHCSSLGEFEQGRPLIEKIKKHYPEYKILLTFFSPSGYTIRRGYKYADYVSYMPFDTPGNARRFLQKVKPEKVFFVKYEFWYFFLRELHRRNIDIYLVSGIFRKNQYFFQWYGRPFRKMIRWFKWIFVQDTGSIELLKSFGFNNVSLSGDTRLDRVAQIAGESKGITAIENFKSHKPLLVAGSTWKKDEELLFKFFRQTDNEFKMIVAPHEVGESNIERIISSLDDFKVYRYSTVQGENIAEAEILIIDSIGLLASLYRYGDFAYIGGGFGKGIHNIAEAAAWGIPVVFGPNHRKFKEAIDLIKQGGAFSIDDYNSLHTILHRFLNNKKFLLDSGKAAGNYISQNAGATQHIMQKVFKT